MANEMTVRWIPVEEALPRDGEWVLATIAAGAKTKCVSTDIRWDAKNELWREYLGDGVSVSCLPGYVTHWMPLPKPAE